MYQFINECVIDNKKYYIFNHIGTIYETLLLDQSPILLKDYGAGSRKNNKTTTIATIAKNATSPTWKGVQLYHIAKFLESRTIIELGTNLGLGTAYLATAAKNSQVFTLEGDPSLHQLATKHWRQLGLDNIEGRCGEFSEVLPSLLNKLSAPIDLAYLDGNHRKEATINYTNQLIPYLSDKGAIIVDDIHWSDDMLEAWNTLKAMDTFSYSVNLGQYGILFWDKSYRGPKQDLTYIKYGYKPWKIGLFAG